MSPAAISGAPPDTAPVASAVFDNRKSNDLPTVTLTLAWLLLSVGSAELPRTDTSPVNLVPSATSGDTPTDTSTSHDWSAPRADGFTQVTVCPDAVQPCVV